MALGPSTPHHRKSVSASSRRAGTAAPPKRGVDHDTRVAVVLQQLRELFRVAQQHFQKVEAKCGVSGAQLWAMSELDGQPGLKVSELARALSIHLSTASNMLDKLEGKAFIRRERTSGDQRVVKVFLTAEGRRCLKRAPRPVQGVLPDALARMPRAAVHRLERDLSVLLELSSVRSPGAALRHLSEP